MAHQEILDNQVRALYEQFTQNEGSPVSRDQKIAFMQQAFSASGVGRVEPAMPSFYALDLVRFGLKQNNADAIRLGERALSEQGERMPRELAMGVKNFLLDAQNNKEYREAMHRSGPLNSTKLYEQKGNAAGPIFALDDPEFRKFMGKNSRREDQWRTPSALAWDHKRHGILGEVVDVERIQRQYERYCRQ